MTLILGISAYYHDSAAALVEDGLILSAAQEERFTRKKGDPNYPRNAVNYVLSERGVTLSDVDYVAFYDKPFLKFERLLETYLAFAPRGFESFRTAMPLWIRDKLFMKSALLKELSSHEPKTFDGSRLLFCEHHLSHAASAFYPSAFDQAAILTLDGVGEWATTTAGVGTHNRIEILKEINFPHSLGLLYSAFTYYLGFKVNSAEYKVMGLAPYGTPRFRKLIFDRMVDVKPDGSFWLDQSFFNYSTGLTMTSERFAELFGRPARKSDERLESFHMDLAASVQAVSEEIVLKLTRSLATETGQKNLCFAGGVALNCVINGKVLRDHSFQNFFIQPAAGDAGGAIGAALATWHEELGKPRQITLPDGMSGALLGPSFSQAQIGRRLESVGAVMERLETETMIARTAEALAEGKAVGWFQGRMEFGPRALGSRSILGDARSPTMQKTLNLKVKYRESFRPFAPSVLREHVEHWFDMDIDSPYMLLVAEVRKELRREMTASEAALFGIDKLNIARSTIPAVTHVDYSARVQTVHRETNPLYHDLIGAFYEKTGCPVIVNTSFNVRGEPIVCTPEDAFRCFMGTDMEWLSCGDYVLKKEAQTAPVTPAHRDNYELD